MGNSYRSLLDMLELRSHLYGINLPVTDVSEGWRHVAPDDLGCLDHRELGFETAAQHAGGRHDQALKIGESHENPAGAQYRADGAHDPALQFDRQRSPWQ